MRKENDRARIERLFVGASCDEMQKIGRRLGLPIPLPESVVEHLRSSAVGIVGSMSDDTIEKLSTVGDEDLTTVLSEIARKGLAKARVGQDSTWLPS